MSEHSETSTGIDVDIETESKLYKAVKIICISPKDAKELVDNYRRQIETKYGSIPIDEEQNLLAEKIVSRYVDLCTVSGGVTSVSSIIPGVGTAVAMVGGGLTDASICMKFQVDMCMCLAEVYGYDINQPDSQQLAFLVAAGGALNKFGAEGVANVASKAGVNLLRQYLKGAALQAVKEFFKRLGIIFTRKALEKALPFGIGIVISATTNRALTKYVGKKATHFFKLDREMRQKEKH